MFDAAPSATSGANAPSLSSDPLRSRAYICTGVTKTTVVILEAYIKDQGMALQISFQLITKITDLLWRKHCKLLSADTMF